MLVLSLMRPYWQCELIICCHWQYAVAAVYAVLNLSGQVALVFMVLSAQIQAACNDGQEVAIMVEME